jgi:lysophospholipase L1-like esterase
MRSSFKLILLFSIALNFAFIGLFLKHRFFPYVKPRSNKITYFHNRQTVFELFPLKKDDIVFAGDSETQFFDLDEYFTGYHIINRGIGDDKTAGLLNRINQITGGMPRKIFIEIGLNDVMSGLSADSTFNNTIKIINRVKRDSPTSEIYLNNVFPCSLTASDGSLTKIIPELNTKLKAYCANNHVVYVDAFSALSENGGLNLKYDSGDHIHLNGQGYFAWSKVLKPYLN